MNIARIFGWAFSSFLVATSEAAVQVLSGEHNKTHDFARNMKEGLSQTVEVSPSLSQAYEFQSTEDITEKNPLFIEEGFLEKHIEGNIRLQAKHKNNRAFLKLSQRKVFIKDDWEKSTGIRPSAADLESMKAGEETYQAFLKDHPEYEVYKKTIQDLQRDISSIATLQIQFVNDLLSGVFTGKTYDAIKVLYAKVAENQQKVPGLKIQLATLLTKEELAITKPVFLQLQSIVLQASIELDKMNGSKEQGTTHYKEAKNKYDAAKEALQQFCKDYPLFQFHNPNREENRTSQTVQFKPHIYEYYRKATKALKDHEANFDRIFADDYEYGKELEDQIGNQLAAYAQVGWAILNFRSAMITYKIKEKAYIKQVLTSGAGLAAQYAELLQVADNATKAHKRLENIGRPYGRPVRQPKSREEYETDIKYLSDLLAKRFKAQTFGQGEVAERVNKRIRKFLKKNPQYSFLV